MQSAKTECFPGQKNLSRFCSLLWNLVLSKIVSANMCSRKLVCGSHQCRSESNAGEGSINRIASDVRGLCNYCAS